MSSVISGFRHVVCAAILSASVALAQQPDYSVPGPIPSAIRSAKSIFISNVGSDSGLFPEPFTGDPDRTYNEFYADLKAAGDFQLVSDPSQADLVLQVRLTAPNGPTTANKQNGTANPRPMFCLTVYDRKTHYVLWTVTQSIELAFLQKTHDRNFDEALSSVVAVFLRVAGRQAGAAH